MKIRVMVADDHAMFRKALRMTLEATSHIEVVAEADDGYSLLKNFVVARPHVVCMDVNMPGLDGIETTRQLLSVQPLLKVIGLSAYIDHRVVADMLRAGARGYVIKMNAGTELPEAIRTVQRNGIFLSPHLGINDVHEFVRQARADSSLPKVR
jgi:DNA-binding NarL/FixJ family response regulator